MREVLLLKCGELILKGLNRGRFESKLTGNLKKMLKGHGDYTVTYSQSTVSVEPLGGADMEYALACAKRLFGLTSISRACMVEKDFEVIKTAAKEYLKPVLEGAKTFKVEAKRADKKFPLNSPQISTELGGFLHDCYPHLTPKMDGPDVTVVVEIREHHAFISGERIRGLGGMPTGTNGRAMLLLSGGIDSPVAGYRMAKRGLELDAVHFYSYPYTSEQAKEKVETLARILSGYTGGLNVYFVPFTEVQLLIKEHCLEDYFTIIMRRMMMRIACALCRISGAQALVTGESLGQVASQTIEALSVTNAVSSLPVFRPLIGMDKEEIVSLSRQIGTFETSILPFEDCCTVFTPRHPQTKPREDKVKLQEKGLDIEAIVQKATQEATREYISLGEELA